MSHRFHPAALLLPVLLLCSCQRDESPVESRGEPGTRVDAMAPASSRTSDNSVRTAGLAEKARALFGERHLPGRAQEFKDALLELARTDPAAALALFDPATMSGEQIGFHELADYLAGSQPELLESWLLENVAKSELTAQGDCLGSGLLALSLRDPERTADLALRIPCNSAFRNSVLISIFDSFSQGFPDRAYAKLASMSLSGSDRDSALDVIIGGALTKNPELARKLVAEIQNANARSIAIGRIISDNLLNGRPEEARQMIGKTSDEEIRLLLSNNPDSQGSLLYKLAMNAPEVLADQLGRIVANQANRDVFEQSVRQLALKRPDLADGIIASLPESPMKDALVGSQYEVMARADVTGTLAKAATLPTAGQQAEAYRQVGSIAGLQGYDSVIASAAQIPEGQQGNFLAAALIPSMGRDAEKVAAFLLDPAASAKLSPDQRADLITRAGGPLAQQSTATATEWMQHLPEADRTAAMHGIARQLAAGNVLALSEMLSSMPRDQVWETGVHVLIRDLDQSDPGAAEKWRALLPKAETPAR